MGDMFIKKEDSSDSTDSPYSISIKEETLHEDFAIKDNLVTASGPSIESKDTSTKSFDCELCPYKSRHKRYLKNHVISRHLPEDEIVWSYCDQCDYKAKFSTHLRKHTLDSHTVEDAMKWFYCKRCSYRAKKESCIRRHEVAKHVPEEEIEWVHCEQCSFQTKFKRNLQCHMRARHVIDTDYRHFFNIKK